VGDKPRNPAINKLRIQHDLSRENLKMRLMELPECVYGFAQRFANKIVILNQRSLTITDFEAALVAKAMLLESAERPTEFRGQLTNEGALIYRFLSRVLDVTDPFWAGKVWDKISADEDLARLLQIQDKPSSTRVH